MSIGVFILVIMIMFFGGFYFSDSRAAATCADDWESVGERWSSVIEWFIHKVWQQSWPWSIFSHVRYIVDTEVLVVNINIHVLCILWCKDDLNSSMSSSSADLTTVMVSSQVSLKKLIRSFRMLLLESSLRLKKWIISLRSSHLYSGCWRIDFEILLLFFNALNGLEPKFIYDLLVRYEPPWPLRSCGTGFCPWSYN